LISNGEYNRGISICGSGNGINMTTNKYKGVRGALCWNDEIAELARRHNDANVCSLPARFISQEMAEKIVDIFLSTDFEGGRHEQRIRKIDL
jgi:ribose 5-phosphate isomerase B